MRAERCEHGGDSGIPSGLREPRGRRNFVDPTEVIGTVALSSISLAIFIGSTFAHRDERRSARKSIRYLKNRMWRREMSEKTERI